MLAFIRPKPEFMLNSLGKAKYTWQFQPCISDYYSSSTCPFAETAIIRISIELRLCQTSQTDELEGILCNRNTNHFRISSLDPLKIYFNSPMKIVVNLD